MAAKYILAVMGAGFLLLAAARIVRDRGVGPAARAWLIVGVVFSVVSAWLWFGVGNT